MNATHQAEVNVDSEKDENEDNESLKNVPTKSIFKMSFKQLLFMAMTSGAIGITLITLFQLWEVSRTLYLGKN